MGRRAEQGARRREAQRRGRIAEYVAAAYLMLKGYRILAIRHRTRLGEIDLIARKGEVVAFVEVKARASRAAALDAVSLSAQRRIRNAGDLWITRYHDAVIVSQRYDIVSISRWWLPCHLIDAF